MSKEKSYVIHSVVWAVVIIIVSGFSLLGWMDANDTVVQVESVKVQSK